MMHGFMNAKRIDICTAGAKSVTGKHCLFIAFVKSIVQEIGISGCIINGHALAVEKNASGFKNSSVGV
jgi:hypothetical protein